MDKIKTGIKRLDMILNGGFPRNCNILLSGEAGTGKTLFGLNFLLEGARKGEKCCYVTLNEGKKDILRAAESIDCLSEIKKFEGNNLQIIEIKLGKDNMNIQKFLKIIGRYPLIDRLVLDNINKLLIHSDSTYCYRINMNHVLDKLKRMNSSLIICETVKGNIDTGKGEAFESDGIINLSFFDYEEKPKRIATINKMRYTAFEPLIPYEFVIKKNSIGFSERTLI